MGKGGGKAKQRVTEYFASVQYGVCQGQVDSLNHIRINDKIAWTGAAVGPSVFSISEVGLFGGLRKEGGVSGHVFWQDGSFGQYAPGSLAAKFGRTPANMPAYRGLANAFFTGPGSLVDEDSDTAAPLDPVEAQPPVTQAFFRIFSKFKDLIVGNGGRSELKTNNGFYWSANQPFIWPCHFGVTRIPQAWYPETATIFHVPDESVALCITIDDSGSMTVDRRNAMKAAVGTLLETLKRMLRNSEAKLDLSIGKWGDNATGSVTYLDASEADLDAARAFVDGFNASSGGTNFQVPAQQAVDFFAQTVQVVPSGDPDLISFNVQYQPGVGGEGDPQRFYFGQIDSLASQPPGVSVGDDVLLTYSSGLTDTITITSVSRSPDGDLWWEFGGVLQNNPVSGENGGFAVLLPNTQKEPPAVSVLRDIKKRVWVSLSDGEAAGDTAALGAAIASDLLDREAGVYSTANETPVDCYAVNLENADISDALLLDNTPGDGVPVVSANNPGLLATTISRAVFPGRNAVANGAHIIYECLTDSAWGMGAPVSAINLTSFVDSADTLFSEGFGLSMIWTRQQPIEDFVKEVLDHIDAALFVDPSTGKFTLKLIRDDYVVEDLPLFDTSVMRVRSFSRRAPGETINEINLTWTNPENEQEETITGQDLGSIVANNGVINSDNRNYYGVRDARLANEILSRDLSVATAPLATAEIEVNRTAWNQFPGSAVRFFSPSHEAAEIVMRVTKINYGKPGDSKILISLTQDVFSFQKPTLRLPPKTQAIPDRVPPEPFRYVVFQTLNHFFTKFYEIGDLVEPEASVAILASTENTGASEAEVVGETVDAAGNAVTDSLATIGVTARGLTVASWAAEPVSTTTGFSDISAGRGPSVGGFGLIQRETDQEAFGELVLFTSFEAGVWTVKRGILDTVPRAWPAGTPIRFFNSASRLSDTIIRSAGVQADWSLLMRTRAGILPLSSSPVRRYTPGERAYAPTRPANVTINGTAFDKITILAGDLEISWANRNRLLEDSQPLAWDDLSVTPEDGQTTRVRVIDSRDLSVVANYPGLTGTSHTVPAADLAGAPKVFVQVLSERDGLPSFQFYNQTVVTQIGYGLDYGFNYGGLA